MRTASGRRLRGFVAHPTASSLIMALMLIAGLFSVNRLNTQFFPDFGIDIINVAVTWSGASAKDVESNIIKALEPELRFLDGVDKVSASARENLAQISIEYQSGSDMQSALSSVESAVSRVTTLPETAENPVIYQLVRYDTISRLVLSGPYNELFLKEWAKRIRDDLLVLGIDKIQISPLLDEEIQIEVMPRALRSFNISLSDIAERIRFASQDIPSGDTVGNNTQQLRGIGSARTIPALSSIKVHVRSGGENVSINDLASINDAFAANSPSYFLHGMPAIELHIQRAEGADALLLAKWVDDYLETLMPSLPENLNVQQFDIAANLIRERINLLLRNGGGGLILVLGILFLFLNSRVAMWVAVGIPTAVLGSLWVMLITGQSINMVSLFALIMMLGIVVDDAIVVGEHAMAQRSAGLSPEDAATEGARRMLTPVLCASLTTIAAFVPVMMISGVIGEIITAIPLVVTAVLAASLIECFLILPGHLCRALANDVNKISKFRTDFNNKYEHFRDGLFRNILERCVEWRYATLSAVLASFIVAIGLVAGGRVQFVFFPSPESNIIYANFAFSPGTARHVSKDMMLELSRSLDLAERALVENGNPIISTALGSVGAPVSTFDRRNSGSGDHLGGIVVELIPSEGRDVRTDELIAAWKTKIQELPGLEELTIRARQGGPPGRDVDVRLYGGEVETLKKAALEVRELLRRFEGVSDIADNLPWGKRELTFAVNERGKMLGFTTEIVSKQVRDGFDGAIATKFIRAGEEVTVRVRLRREVSTPATLRSLYVHTLDGVQVPLLEVVDIEEGRGFSVIRRENGLREVAITAEMQESIINPSDLMGSLQHNYLPEIVGRHGIKFRFAGRAEEQGDTLDDMKIGTALGLGAIYIILAWVFASYVRPIVVMSIIPFAVVGAIVGHWLLGFDLTILSLIGLLGLSGIVVNDSIILVTSVNEKIKDGQTLLKAVVAGTQERLRPVVLTSLTTIGGLIPLLFETSLQAQFLKPMALTIVFGLIATTILVLVVIPALIFIQEDCRLKLALTAPEAGNEEHQNRKQLKSTEQHGGRQNPFG